ncbi:MAG: autotransporter assembly complex family protein [Pseudomonadota bacterium]
MSIGLTPSVALAQVDVTVEVTGISGEELKNVMLLLSIEQQKSSPELSPGRLRRLHSKAPQEIEQALEPFGYYRVAVEAELKEAESGWQAAYHIDPGPPLPVTAIDVTVSGEAAEDPAFDTLLESPPLAVGDTFNHSVYEQWKRDLQRLADERGYFDAAFSRHRVLVDLETYDANIELQMASGPRYRFGPVNISGDLKIDEERVRRFITFKAGEPYSATKLLQLQEGLYGSDYFARVDIRAEHEAVQDRRVPIALQLTMNKRTRYQIGLGYGTDTGPRVSIGMERRYVNRRGHRFSTKLGLSELEDKLSAEYVIPLKRIASDRVVIRSHYNSTHTEDIDSTALSFGAGKETTRGRWFRSYFLNFLQEEFDIGLQSGDARLLMPTLAWSRLSTDDVLNTVRGSRIGLELRGARDGVVSNTSLARAHLNGKIIRSIGEGRFLVRSALGTSWAPEFDNLPPSVRFFAGGDHSVRGYAYQSLGPEDAEGNVIGGKHLLTGSVEYEHRMGEKWRSAIFIDAGNAFADYEGDLEQGAGIGIRRRLPIGWLRVDIAQAFTAEGKPWRLHITLGPDL